MARTSSPSNTSSPLQTSNDNTIAYNSANKEQMRIFAACNSEATHAAALAPAQEYRKAESRTSTLSSEWQLQQINNRRSGELVGSSRGWRSD
jgi:hypothetical protein